MVLRMQKERVSLAGRQLGGVILADLYFENVRLTANTMNTSSRSTTRVTVT